MTSETAYAALVEGPCDLSTPRYALRPLTDDDATDILAHYGDPAVIEFLDIQPMQSRSDAFDMIDWAKALRASATGVRWRISDAAGGFVGTCGFHLLTHARGRRAEIGFDLGRAWQGRGVMAEVMPAATAFGFGVLGVRRIEALVTPGNARCCRLLERQGFLREGVLRDYAFWNGRFWDQIVYSLLSPASAAD